VGSGTSLLRSALEKGWDAEIEGMTKSGLIQRLAAANPHLYARDIERRFRCVERRVVSG
jgi:hypothetical protein